MHMYTGFSILRGLGECPPISQKFAHSSPTWKNHPPFSPTKILFSPHQKLIILLTNKKCSSHNPIKSSFLTVVTPCTIFVLISYSFETHVMLILILIDVQY